MVKRVIKSFQDRVISKKLVWSRSRGFKVWWKSDLSLLPYTVFDAEFGSGSRVGPKWTQDPIEKALRLGAADLSEVDLRMQGLSGKSVSADRVDTNFLGKNRKGCRTVSQKIEQNNLKIKENSTNNRWKIYQKSTTNRSWRPLGGVLGRLGAILGRLGSKYWKR